MGRVATEFRHEGGLIHVYDKTNAKIATFDGENGKVLQLAKLDFTGIEAAAADTDGAIVKIGTTAAPIASAAANQSMVRLIFDFDHDGGYGFYTRSYISTAAVGADAARIFGTVNNVAASTARGLHASLSFGTSGTVTGLAAAIEATLHMPSTAGMAGTNYAIKAAINADAATSDPVGATTIAFIGIVAQGTQGGLDDLDTDGVVFDFTGLTAAADTTKILSSVSLAELPTGTVGLRCKVNGSLYYLPLVAAAEWN